MAAPAHLIKTARRQLRKLRHRGPSTDVERRLVASADRQREQGLGWRYDGFAATSTADLLAMLGRIGLPLDEDAVRAEALEAGSPTGLAGRWEQRARAEGPWRELPTLAARELWRRLLAERRSAEVVADDVDALLEEAEIRPERAALWAQAARRLVAACIVDGAADLEFFRAVQRECAADLIGWMVEVPSALLGTPDAEAAPEVCEQFARLADAKALLAERAEILARLGRRDDAVRQIEALLEAHPEDPVVLLKAGGTFEVLGDLGRSQQYLRLYVEAMRDPRSQPLRLAAAKAGVDLPGAAAGAAAPGPNERCPCGSGKKYKRCHGLMS